MYLLNYTNSLKEYNEKKTKMSEQIDIVNNKLQDDISLTNEHIVDTVRYLQDNTLTECDIKLDKVTLKQFIKMKPKKLLKYYEWILCNNHIKRQDGLDDDAINIKKYKWLIYEGNDVKATNDFLLTLARNLFSFRASPIQYIETIKTTELTSLICTKLRIPMFTQYMPQIDESTFLKNVKWLEEMFCGRFLAESLYLKGKVKLDNIVDTLLPTYFYDNFGMPITNDSDALKLYEKINIPLTIHNIYNKVALE